MINLNPVFIREEVIREVRSFFEKNNFHEVITPSLNFALPLEPNLYAFTTNWKTSAESREMYLSTSPESGLKKMLANGIGNCFAISKSFRNLEGAGSLHTPEFLMLEWYREDADYTIIMHDVQNLVLKVKERVDNHLSRESSSQLTYQGTTISLKEKWPVYSLVDLFGKYANLDYFEILDDEIMLMKARHKGYNTENATWGELFDQIFVNEIEFSLPMSPFFIVDFPAKISPLCAPKKSNPLLVERFEVFLLGKELGNGNSENTDSEYVEKLFRNEQKYRSNHLLIAPPIDMNFIASLKEMSFKKYAGIGLGIDRLAMIMADVTSITDVEVFYR